MPRYGVTFGFLTILSCFVASVSPGLAKELVQKSAPYPVESATEEVQSSASEEAVKPGLAGSFLSSRFAKEQEDVHDAAKYLREALAKDPDNISLKHETLRASLLAGDIASAVALAGQLKDESKTDALVATLLMLDAVHAKKYTEANHIIADAPGVGLFGVVRPVIGQWLGVAAGEALDATEMQAAMDKAGFFAPFLTYHAALMNDVAGNQKVAQEYYLKASQVSDSTPYRVVEAFANFEARQGKWEEAQKLFDAYAKANPDSSLLPDKITPQAESPAPLVASANDGLAEVFFTTASILFGEESSKDTFLYLRVALDLRPEFPPAQLMLANLYEQSGDYPKAIAVYDAMPKGTVFYRRGQVRKALNLEALDKRDEAIAYLETLSAQYPSDATALITKGDMLRAEEKYVEAAAAYSEAAVRSEPLRPSDWPLLYARGISYERAGQWPKAEADFLAALKLEPNQPDVLNYLGYSWLMMNKNIQQASDYLEIAVSARPRDAHIVDSAGWAKYLTGDYSGAVAALEKALDLKPDDATVNEHLGDAYWRLGRQTEARYQWNRALSFNPEPEQMLGLKRKIASGLPPAPSTSVNHAGMRALEGVATDDNLDAPAAVEPEPDDAIME